MSYLMGLTKKNVIECYMNETFWKLWDLNEIF